MIEDTNFSWGEIILIGQFFTVGSTDLKSENKYLVLVTGSKKRKLIVLTLAKIKKIIIKCGFYRVKTVNRKHHKTFFLRISFTVASCI